MHGLLLIAFDLGAFLRDLPGEEEVEDGADGGDGRQLADLGEAGSDRRAQDVTRQLKFQSQDKKAAKAETDLVELSDEGTSAEAGRGEPGEGSDGAREDDQCAGRLDGRRLPDGPQAAAGLGRRRVRLGPARRPSQSDLAQLTQELGLHPLSVEDALHGQQRPKAERFGDMLAVALKTLRYAEEETAVETGDIMIFVGARSGLTVRHGPIDPCLEAARRLDADPDMLRLGPWAVLHAVLDVAVDAYSDAARKVRATLNGLEDEVFSTSRVDHTQSI